MGNHTAGDLINIYAEKFSAARAPGETALEVLDKAVAAAKGTSGFSPDAEFEASDPNKPGHVHPEFDQWTDPHPKAVLGMLMLEAFAPDGVGSLSRYSPMSDADDENEELASDAWWEEVYEPFKKRYGLC